MRTAVKLVTLMGNTLVPMAARIQATQPANLIAYWKLGETSGTTADDSSATAADGVYSGTYTLGQPGIGDGSLSTSFTPTTGRVSLAANIATLDTPFDPLAGTLLAWGQVSGAGVWTDATSRFMVELGVDANNRVYLYKDNAGNNIVTGVYTAGGTAKQVSLTGFSPLTFFSLAITWDKTADAVKFYVNGVQQGATQTGLGVWVGSLSGSFSALGAFASTGGAPWSGNLAQIAAWKVALTATEVASIGIL